VFVSVLLAMLERHGIVVKLFADDVKVYMKIVNCDDARKMQCALDLISKCPEEWQLSVSVSKCNLVTLGRSLAHGKYYISDNQLPSCTQSRDLGIIVNSDLTPADHIQQITVKAHQRANSILRFFVSGNISLLVRAFLVYFRPFLQYNSVVWSPYLKQDIMKIEKVQRQFTKRLRGYGHMSYVDRLAKL